MITRRTIVIAICAVALGVPIRAGAQQKGKLWRVGYLEYGTRQFAQASGRYPAFIDGMRALGYVEGKDFVVEARYADGKAERLAPLAQELVKSSVDVIVSTGTPATQAAQRATPTVPIVAAVVTDPVVERFASSLSRPGKNITGLTNSSTDIA
jgi:putative ABC transport system substrate-binding protein